MKVQIRLRGVFRQNTVKYLGGKFLISDVNQFEKELQLDEYASEIV